MSSAVIVEAGNTRYDARRGRHCTQLDATGDDNIFDISTDGRKDMHTAIGVRPVSQVRDAKRRSRGGGRYDIR